MDDTPSYDVDFYDEEFIADPLPHYQQMRALGPVVFLPRHGNYAAVQFSAVREALKNAEVFCSGQGVAADDAGCTFLRGNTLASDGAPHQRMRSVMGVPLSPGELAQHRPKIERAARELVEELCRARNFDGMKDVARALPLRVVTELVGLPPEGRDRMLEWASASFDILGVQNQRGREALMRIAQMREWIAERATAERLKPGSWTARIMELRAGGAIPEDMAHRLIRDYINPSLDTTISATGELLLQLGRNPEVWTRLRREPQLVPNAVGEAVRLASPIRSFTRTVTREYNLGGVRLPAGSRVMMVFASANRDALHFPNPDKFVVDRIEQDHVGFGHGIHACVGMHLARLEMTALLGAMIPRIERFYVGAPSVAINNTIRSYSEMAVTVNSRALVQLDHRQRPNQLRTNQAGSKASS